MSFSFDEETNSKMSFLDVEISRENGKFVTTVYYKPTFSGVYTHFESFLPSSQKFGMLYTLADRCFTLCSDGRNRELVTLKEIFKGNGYPKSFIDKCFKKFLNRLHIIKPTSSKVEKKALRLVLTYLGSISLQFRTKIRNPMKSTLNHCKLQVIFKNERKLSNMFRFKDRVPYDSVSGVVYEYTCGRCNSSYYDETERHLKVRSGEHIGISLLTFKKTKPSKESSIHDHLLECDNNHSFDEFTILSHGNKKYLLETKENLLIKRDQLVQTNAIKNIRFATLHFFNTV